MPEMMLEWFLINVFWVRLKPIHQRLTTYLRIGGMMREDACCVGACETGIHSIDCVMIRLSHLLTARGLGWATTMAGAALIGWSLPDLWIREGVERGRGSQRASKVHRSRVASEGLGSQSSGRIVSGLRSTGGRVAFSIDRLLAMDDPLEELARLQEHLKTCTSDEIAAICSRVGDMVHPGMRAKALTAIFAQWTKLEPAASLAAAKALGRDGMPHVQEVWRCWGGHDPDAAIAAAKAAGQWPHIGKQIIVGLAAAQPLRVLQRWGEFGTADDVWNREMNDAITAASKKSPAEVVSLLKSFPWDAILRVSSRDINQKNDLLSPLFRYDSLAVFQALHAIPVGKIRESVLKDATFQLALTDPEAAVRITQALPAGPERAGAALEVARGVAAKSPAQALRRYAELTSSPLAPDDLETVLASHHKLTAKDLTETLAGMPGGPLRERVFQAFFSKFIAQGNLEEGRIWLSRQNLATLEPAALSGAATIVSRDRWPSYLDAMDRLTPAQRTANIKKLGRRFVDEILREKDPDKAAILLASLDPRLQAAVALGRMQVSELGSDGLPSQEEPSAILARNNDQFTIRIYSNGAPKPDLQKQQAIFEALPPAAQQAAALPYIQGYIEGDHSRAAELFTKYPPHPNNPAAAFLSEQLAGNWLNNDSLRASQWISGLPQGTVRDAAVYKLVENVINDDLPAAQQWAATIQDHVTKQRVAKLFNNTKRP